MGVILITGATGFIGRAVSERAETLGYRTRLIGRRSEGKVIGIGAIDENTDWSPHLKDVDCIIHLAARVHVMSDHARNSLFLFRKTNTEGTRRLAQAAAKASVRRLIFVSSIKVNGEETLPGRTFSPEDVSTSLDPYAQSKWDAEQTLHAISRTTDLETVIIRPPLVYGPGVKANFYSLLSVLARGYPLPFKAIHNLRSLVALDNLVDLIMTCVNHTKASNQTFLVSDDEDLSTPDLIRRMAIAMERPARLFSVSPELLLFGASLVGKREVMRRLCDSLQVDIHKTHSLLGWTPPTSVNAGLNTVVRWFLNRNKKEVSW